MKPRSGSRPRSPPRVRRDHTTPHHTTPHHTTPHHTTPHHTTPHHTTPPLGKERSKLLQEREQLQIQTSLGTSLGTSGSASVLGGLGSGSGSVTLPPSGGRGRGRGASRLNRQTSNASIIRLVVGSYYRPSIVIVRPKQATPPSSVLPRALRGTDQTPSRSMRTRMRTRTSWWRRAV